MKEKRINRVIKKISTKFFNGERNDDIKNTRTMKVSVEVSDELRKRLDILMQDSDIKRREVLEDLMKEFYNNPQELIDKAGKITKKINKRTGEITENHKFSSLKLYGWLYTKYAKGNSYKEYASSLFYEGVLINVAKEVCSFFDKYYTIQEEINKTIKENKETEKDITIKIIPLIDSVSTKTENDEYNKIVRQNNILINLHNQKTGEKLPFFKSLKGFPSFPLVEKKKELDYTELEKLFEPHLEKAKLFWSVITKEQMQKAMAHFYGKNIYKLFKYYYKLKATEPGAKNFDYILNDWKPADINVILERIDKKIAKIGINTNQDKKQKTEWLRGKSLIIFEYLRHIKPEEFAKVRGEFDLKSSINTGFISRNKDDKKVFEITGFSASKKSAIIIDGDKTKQRYSLAFNISKDHSDFKVDDNGKFKGYLTVGGSKKKPKEGEEKEDKNTQLKNIKLDIIGTFILPLNFGKRYAREYLYNNELNFGNKGITLNNARVIKDGERYFVAITFTKLKGNKAKKDIDYEAIIGVDRGEKLPVACSLVDKEGKLIKYLDLEICNDFSEKQKKIDKIKREKSSKTGKYDDYLRKKARNLSKATIEKIGAELLYYATKYNALIVLEDLNREFGINPIMATRQYSKIEDFLTRKLKENGLMYGDILANTRSGLLGKVVAKHTSKTCSNCGFVFASDKIKALEPYKKDDGVYYVKLDGKEISLDIDYELWIRNKGKKEKFNANQQIVELKKKDTKKNKELIEKTLFNSLNPRKTQEEFICPICGHRENADMQASVNIARKWLFKDSQEAGQYKKKKDTKDKINYWESWENYCKNNKDKWNQNN